MATSAASVSKATITFSSGFAAQIIDWSWDGIERAAIDTSHQGLALAGSGKFGNKTFIPSRLNDPGSITVNLNFNPDTLPPIEGAAETFTLAVGDSSTQATWAGSAFMTGFTCTGPLEDRMTASLTVKFSGNVTRTAGT